MLTLEIGRTDDIFSIIVTEQSNKINNLISGGFYSKTTKWTIDYVSTPEINFPSRTLYLRGTLTQNDFRELNTTPETLQLVYNTLYDFAENYDFGITYYVYKNYAEIKIDESNTRIKASIGLEDIQSNDMIRCRHCKEFFNPDDIHLKEIDGQNKHLCDKCFNKITTKCTNCTKFVTKAHEFIRSNGERFKVCTSCREFKITQCDGCKAYEIIRVSRLEIEIGEDGNLEYGKRLCGICLSKIGKKNCYLHVYDNKYDNCLCATSYNFKPDIYSYNTNVLDSYSPDKDTKELFGIEIEVGTHRRNRGFFKEILKETKRVIASDAIMKWDASIDYLDGSNKEEPNDHCGFEITTRPMNYKNAKNFLEKLAKERHSLLRCWEVGTTGIHIHVNKKYLRPIEIG
ncbi:MAG: hypothetical protein LC101_00015, partial [Flavobacteriales bacterium]|nr:hypothetical protein [Flavobacteriales bacterium]